jgi:hypothetical protein
MDFQEEFINKYFESGSKTLIINAIQNCNLSKLSVYEIEDLQCLLSLFMINVDRVKRRKITEFYEEKNLENTFGYYETRF